jgi:hypothetical protein
MMNDLEGLLGRAVFQLWPDLPRDMRERIFEAASNDRDERRRSAVVLHHPRTAFPLKPSALAWAKSQKKTQPQRGSLDQHSYCPDRIYRLGATLLVLMEVIRTYLVLAGKVPPNSLQSS